MPTHGTVLEAMLGECDACDDFIQQSRLLDLRTNEAKTRQEEAEARRRELRLEATPPDLSPPNPGTAGRVVVTGDGSSEPPP